VLTLLIIATTIIQLQPKEIQHQFMPGEQIFNEHHAFISGIISNINGCPVSWANITYWESDSLNIANELTDVNGAFTIVIPVDSLKTLNFKMAAPSFRDTTFRNIIVEPKMRLQLNITLAACEQIDSSEEYGTISGVVTDSTGCPIPGVIIRLEGTNMGAATNINGKFKTNCIKAGFYNISAYCLGFEKSNLTDIKIPPNGVINLNYVLKARVINKSGVPPHIFR
jgi:hypothetical protein